MNPNSGPGYSPNPNYVTAVRDAQAAGIAVVGYVYTGYGTRSLTDTLPPALYWSSELATVG